MGREANAEVWGCSQPPEAGESGGKPFSCRRQWGLGTEHAEFDDSSTKI